MSLAEDLLHLINQAAENNWDVTYLQDKAEKLYAKNYEAYERVKNQKYDVAMRWILRNNPNKTCVIKYRNHFAKYCRVKLTGAEFNQIMIRCNYTKAQLNDELIWIKREEDSDVEENSSTDESESDAEGNFVILPMQKIYVFMISVPAYTETVVRIDKGDEKTIESYDKDCVLYAKTLIDRADKCLTKLLSRFEEEFTTVDDHDTFTGDLGEMILLFNKVVIPFA